MTAQLHLPIPRPPTRRAPFVPRSRDVTFDFIPGPEAEPRTLDVVPGWLRISLIDGEGV